MNVKEVLIEARKLIKESDHWKADMESDYGLKCSVVAPSLVIHREEELDDSLYNGTLDALHDALPKKYQNKHRVWDALVDFNDSRTKRGQVLALFTKAINNS